jgi:predicted RNase H-like HicB family nuclease
MGPYTAWLVISRAKDVPGEWVAHALEFDVVTQGSSAEQAREMAIEAVRMVLEEDLREGRDPFAHRAPEDCWQPLLQIWTHGHPITTGEFTERLHASDEASVFAVQMVFTPKTANELKGRSVPPLGYAAYVAPALYGSAPAPGAP